MDVAWSWLKLKLKNFVRNSTPPKVYLWNKDLLEDLYFPGNPVGRVAGLLPLYAQLVLIFKDNIAPSGGNNDAVRTSMVNLLYYASQATADSRAGQHYNLDVMDFICNEMFEAMVTGNSIPYIMMLIKHTLPT